MCWCVCWCGCIELCPSNATKTLPISRATASVEARYLHLHPPLLASKVVLSSWRLVVVCALTTTDVTGITSMYQAGTTWYHALYMCESTVSIYVRTNINGMYRCQRFTCRILIYIYECIRILGDVRMAYLGDCMHILVVVVVVVVFTIKRSFYPMTSSIPPVSFLIPRPREILERYQVQIMWSQTVRQRKTQVTKDSR